MKNKHRLIVLLALSAMGLTACNFSSIENIIPSNSASRTPATQTSDSQGGDEQNQDIKTIYNLYVVSLNNSGVQPLSYEEWLESIVGPKGEPGHSPVITIGNDGYWYIDGNNTNVRATGSDGKTGKDGTSLITGNGSPNNNLGNKGDSYVDLTTFDYYLRGDNGWEKKGNFAGAAGQSGNSLRTGSGSPESLLGQSGDSYVDTDTWNFYVKSSNSWQFVGNLKGTNGQTAWSNTILPSDHGYVTCNLGSALVGSDVMFTAYPDDGYYLSDLLLNNKSVIGAVVDNTYTTQMVENGFVVKATFTAGSAPIHVHQYETTYSSDANNHWRECVAHDGAMQDFGPHTYGEWILDKEASETEKGHHHRFCTVCNYRQDEDIEKIEHTHSYGTNWVIYPEYHCHECSCGDQKDVAPHNFNEINRVEPTGSTDGYITEKCTICGYERVTPIYSQVQTIDIYATNDIHGQIYEERDESDSVSRAPLDRYMTFLKNQKTNEETNALLLDQGDTWQGSIYSNYNHGGLITDVMNYVQFDARTIGNHDFDWGIDAIKNNTKKSYNGYTTPTLGANIYNYDFDSGREGSQQQSDLGISSVTYDVGGVKVGIIGTIGSSQITSICTNYVKDICFKAHIPIIKAEAEKLRNDENCDVVILSHHGDQDDLVNNNLSSYIDIALCAHSHQREWYQEDDLIYVQGGHNSAYVSYLTFSFNKENHQIVNAIDGAFLSAQQIYNAVPENAIDANIVGMIENNRTVCARTNPISEVLANNVTGDFYKQSDTNLGQDGTLPNLMADAMFEQAIAEGHNDIYCSYVNYARHDLASGSWNFADVFEAFPFENEVYIMEVSGADFINEISNWNFVRKNMNIWPNNNEFDINGTYKIAVIDYLGVHSNSNRRYDYFPSANGEVCATLSKNYRNILIDYLKAHNYNKGVELSPSAFSSSLSQFTRVNCAQFKTCTLTFMFNYDGAGEYTTTTGKQGQNYSNFFPANPSRNGYTFKGWYFDAACTQAVSGKITEDKTLYAKWEEGQTSGVYELNFTLDDLGNNAGHQVLTVSAVDSSSNSINVSVEFEDAKYNTTYNEFGLGSLSGVTFTVPNGYAITAYEFYAYGTYNNLELYADSSKTEQYSVGDTVMAFDSDKNANTIKYTGSGVSYPTLYAYSIRSNGYFYFYYMNLTIERA